MTREQIADLVARRADAYRRLDVAALAADHAEQGTMESPMAGTVTGRAAIQGVYRTWFTAFPDFRLEAADTLIDGDRVAQFGTIHGSDTGGFMGLPPSGRALKFPIVFLYVLEGDSIVRFRTIYDFTGVLMQLGVLKAKPA